MWVWRALFLGRSPFLLAARYDSGNMAQEIKAVRPPIEYPSIVIGDTLYFARFGLGSLYRLEQWGYSTRNWNETVKDELEAGRNIRLTCAMAAASLGVVEGGKWKYAGWMPEDLADAIDDGADLGRVISEAMAKAPWAQAAPAAPGPETEQGQAA